LSLPIHLVHGRFNPLGDEKFTSMNRFLKRRLYGRSVLSVEGAENKLMDRLPLPWPANPNLDPAEPPSPQALEEGLDPLVAPITAILGNLHSSEWEIQVIMDNQDSLRPHAQSFRTHFDGFSAQVHESLGAKQKHFTILKSSETTLPFKTAAQQPDSQRPGPPVDHHEPDVVTRVTVFRPGVPKAYRQE
jgi:hypothetical protein